MNIDKVHLRHCMLLYFHRGKTAAETTKILCEAYGNNVVSERTCRGWFVRFRSGDFDVSDRLRSGRPETIKDERLQALLDENSTRTQGELADQLGVTQVAVSKRLYAMGKIKKKGKWISHQLIEEHCAQLSDINSTSLITPLRESSPIEFYQKNTGFGSRCRRNIVPKLRKNRRIDNKWGMQYHTAVHDAVFGRQCLPYMPTEPSASLSEEFVESDPLYVCKQCKDCFRFQNSFEDHNIRHSWILGFWCTNCFITICTHITDNETTSACSICVKKESDKRSYLRKRGLIKNQKFGAVKVFYNQCQFFEHLKLHGLNSVDMGDLMLMPLPTDISDNDWSSELEITCEALMEHTFLSRMHIVDWLNINKMEDNWWKIGDNMKNDVNLISKVVSGYEGRKLFETFGKLPVDRLTYISSYIRKINNSSSDIEFVNTDLKNNNKKHHFYNTVSDRNISENEDNPCTSTDIAFIDCGPTLKCFESELSQRYVSSKQPITKSTQNIQTECLAYTVKANDRKKVAISKNRIIRTLRMIRENVTVKSNKKTNNIVNQSHKGSIQQQKVAQLSTRRNARNVTNKSTVKTGVNKTLNSAIQIDAPSSVKKIKLHETTSDHLEPSKANCNSKILTIQDTTNVDITSIISQLPPHLISNKKLVLIEQDADGLIIRSKNENTNEKKLNTSNVSDDSNKETNIALENNLLKNKSITIKKQQASNKIVIKTGKKYLIKQSKNMNRSSKDFSVMPKISKMIKQTTSERNISTPASTVFNEGENISVEQTALSHNSIPCLTPSPSPSELSNSSSYESQVKQTLITSASQKVPPNLISISPNQKKHLVETISLITKKDGYVYMNAKLSDYKTKEDSQDMCDVIVKYRQEMINNFYQLDSFELKKRINYLQHVSEEMREVMNFLSDNVFKEKLRFISNLQRILEKCFHKCNQNIQDEKDEKDEDILLNEWKLQFKTTDVSCPSCYKIMKPKLYIAGFSKLSKVDNVYCSCYKHVCDQCLVYQGSLSRFIMHQNFHKKLKPFICPDCRCKFISAKFLEVHTWTACFHILKRHMLACKICEIDGFRDIESVTRHFAVMHSDTKIACEHCFKVLSSYAEYIKHYTETHSSILERNPIRLVICRLGGDIIRFENYMLYLKRCSAIRKVTWYKCPFCSLVILEKMHVAVLNTHLRDHHLHRLKEVISREAFIDIFGEECLSSAVADINATSKNSTNTLANTNDTSYENDIVIPKIISTQTIASNIFECGSQNTNDTWVANCDDLVSSIDTNESSKVIKKVDGSEETNLIQKVSDDGPIANTKQMKSLISMPKILTEMDKKPDVQSEMVQDANVKNNLSHKDVEKTKTERAKYDNSKQKMKEKKGSNKYNNNSTALDISDSIRLEFEIKNKISLESDIKYSKPEIPLKTDGRIKVVDIRKICEPNIYNPFLSEPSDTQLEHENENYTASILKPPPLAKIPQHLLECSKVKRSQDGSKNIVKYKKSSRNVIDKPKLRIAINESTDMEEKYVDYLCHLCGEKINTLQSVVRLHFLEKHSSEYKLMTISPRLLRLSPDFINGGYKQVLNNKKRKSDNILFTSKRKRRWTPKKQVEIKDINLSDAGLCIEQETAEDEEGNFKCKKCGQRCIDMSNLREHIAANHRLKGRYLICLECGDNFVVKPSLQMHLKAFHGIEDPTSYMTQNPLYAPDINSDAEIEGRTTIANQCYVCMAVFEDKAAVDKHLRVHGMAFLNRKRIEAKNALKSPEKNMEETKQICVKDNSRKSVKCSRPAETILEKLNATK